ncbi:MAG TPA: hypothetical protein VM597_26930, partial [Gemmataceae bacterium]|nr:hypothetical protein [Gemmataceae bacterium]
MPANPTDDLRTVRRWSLAGFAAGAVFALVVVPVEFNYLCRRADGTIGPRVGTTFPQVVKGPDGKFVVGALAPPDTSRSLYWHEKLIHGLPSAVPYLLFATFIGYAIGRGRVRARAARLEPLTQEQADYGESAVRPGNSRPEAVCPSPAGLRTPHQIVRREVIIGLMWGLGIAAVVTPFVLNYRCIRADGSYGPVPVTPVFATVGAGNAPAP